MDGKKVLLWIAGGVLIGGGIWLTIIQIKKWKDNNDDDSKNPSSKNPDPQKSVGIFSTPALKDSPFPLQMGSTGVNVESLQRNLNLLGAGIEEDGKFGPKTNSAVFQKYGFGGYPVTEEVFNAIVNKVKGQEIADIITGTKSPYS